MIVKLNFSLSAWIKELEIEADSVDEAKDKLLRMTVEEIIENAIVDESDCSDITAEVSEAEYVVRAHDIEYDINAEDMLLDYDNDELDEMTEDEIEDALQEFKASLPKELVLTVFCAPDDLDESVVEAISDEVGYLVDSFDYDIIFRK